MATVSNGNDAVYRVTVREFPSSIEVTTKPVNHELERARSLNHGFKGAPKLLELSEEERALKDEENVVRSIRRAKQAVRWQVQRLEADHLLTLTYRENMQDIDRLKRDFDVFRRLVKARYPEWGYVAAREQQERGAWHLHLAVKGRQDIKYLRTCWYKVLGCLGAVGLAVLGAVNIKPPTKRFSDSGHWRSNKLASYLTKYIDKAFDLLERSSKRYWSSKGLPQSVVTRYWLAGDALEIIQDAFDLAMYHGMEDFPAVLHQSLQRSLIYMQGFRYKNCFSGDNDVLQG